MRLFPSRLLLPLFLLCPLLAGAAPEAGIQGATVQSPPASVPSPSGRGPGNKGKKAGGAERLLQGYYEDALARFAEGAWREAIIQARNALQEAPEHLPARILLGRALLRSGDPAAAATEFEAALEAGADPNLIRPLLARAWLRQHRPRLVVSRLDPWSLSGDGTYRALLLRAQAFVEMGELEKADWMYAEAAKANPEALAPQLGRWNVQLLKGRVEKACKPVPALVAAHPGEAGAWFLAARCALARGDKAEALEAFGRALVRDPDHLTARLGRAALEIEMGRLSAARKDLDRLAGKMPDEPLVAWLKAVLARRMGDTEVAREALNRAATLLDSTDRGQLADQPGSLLLAAGVAEDLGKLGEARAWLDLYVQRVPADLMARKRLARVLLAQGEAGEVLSLLGASLGAGDAEVLGLLGQAYLARGDTLQALDYLTRAVKVRPRVDLGLALAQAFLGSRQPEKALAELERIHANRPQDLEVGVRLGNLALRQGRPKRALKVARELLARQPESREARNLLAAAELALGQSDVAFTALEEILGKAPGYLPAEINLAWVQYRQGHAQAARAHLLALSQRHPEDYRVLDALGQLAEAEGQLQEAIQWRRREARISPGDLAPQLALADLQLRAGQVEEAAALVERLQSRWPDDLSVMLIQGRLEEVQGKTELARITYRHMTTLASYNSAWLQRIATVQQRLGAVEDAYWSLYKAAQGDPRDLNVQVRLGELELALGKLEDLEARLDRLAASHGRDARVLTLQGGLALARNAPQKAVAAYAQAFGLTPDSDIAWKLYRARTLLGDDRRALDELQRWVADHPEDPGIQRRLASALIQAGREAEAGKVYARMLQKHAVDAGILNNLALIRLHQGDTAAALALARQAYERAPGRPEVADTLGWVLVSEGRSGKGLGYLREAQSRRASDPEIHYHIAVALERLGRRDDARREIETLDKDALPKALAAPVRNLEHRLGKR